MFLFCEEMTTTPFLFYRSKEEEMFETVNEPTVENMQIVWAPEQLSVLLRQSISTSTLLTARMVFVIWFKDTPFDRVVKQTIKFCLMQNVVPLSVEGAEFSIVYYENVRHLLMSADAFAKTPIFSSTLKKLIWKLFSCGKRHCFASVLFSKNGDVSIHAGSMNLSGFIQPYEPPTDMDYFEHLIDCVSRSKIKLLGRIRV